MASDRQRGRYTQKRIAEDLGISLITVQRALNGTGYVSAALRERINAHIRKIGYTPHRAAQTLARSRNRLLAVLSTDYPEYFWNDVARGVEIASRQVSEFGYQASYYRVPVGDTEGYLRRLRRLRRNGVEMVAVVNNRSFEMRRVFAALDRWEMPYVTFNIDAPESNRLASVGPDYVAEGRLAGDFLRHFAAEGDQVLHVKSDAPARSPSPGSDITGMRHEGLSDVLSSYGVDAEVLQLDRGIPERDHAREIHAYIKRARRTVKGVFLTHLVPDLLEVALPIPDVKIITCDYSPDVRDYLMRDEIDAVIFSNPILQGYYAVKLMEQHFERGETSGDGRLTVAHSIMLKENVALQENQLFEFNTVGGPQGALR
jgi:LacI family transcriptional regulator